MVFESRGLRATDLLDIAQRTKPLPDPRTKKEPEPEPEPPNPREQLRNERRAAAMAITATLSPSEDESLRKSITSALGYVPSKEDANWSVVSPAASPVASPVRPATGASTASQDALELLAAAPLHRVYDPTVPMGVSDAGVDMRHTEIGNRFSWHRVGAERARLHTEKAAKRADEDKLMAQTLVAARSPTPEAEPEPEPAPLPRQPSYALPRLWHEEGDCGPRGWWPARWVHPSDQSRETVDEGDSAVRRAHLRNYGKMHGGWRDVPPGHDPPTFTPADTFTNPARDRMGRLKALRELPSGLRYENDTVVQTIVVREPGTKYSNPYSQRDGPGMTRPYIFRSEQKGSKYHNMAEMPPLPPELLEPAEAMSQPIPEEEVEEEGQDLGAEDPLLQAHVPGAAAAEGHERIARKELNMHGSSPEHADMVAAAEFRAAPREYAMLPHRGLGEIETAGAERCDTTGYFSSGTGGASRLGQPITTSGFLVHSPARQDGRTEKRDSPWLGQVRNDPSYRPLATHAPCTPVPQSCIEINKWIQIPIDGRRFVLQVSGEYSFLKAKTLRKDKLPSTTPAEDAAVDALLAAATKKPPAPDSPASPTPVKRRSRRAASVPLPEISGRASVGGGRESPGRDSFGSPVTSSGPRRWYGKSRATRARLSL